METVKLFVGGKWRDSSSGEYDEVIDPARGEAFARAPAGTEADVDDAVAAAREAYETEWCQWDARERGNLLLELARVVEANEEELVEIETKENGKPLHEARNDLKGTAGAFRYYGGAADKYHGETIPERNHILDLTIREPYGVVGIIIPWNWPPMHVADFLAPALACGNTVVLKPAPETPLSALRLAELFEERLPAGVFNVVTGGVEPGAALTAHPDVDKLAFTGNSETGKKVLAAAAVNVTPAMMELGGKNANILFPDADLDRAIPGAVEGSFYNTGEACSSSERILVHESIYDDVVERFAAEAEGLVVGEGTNPETDVGPLSSEQQYDKVTGYIEQAEAEGARLVFSGETPDDPELSGGYYVPPHVFADVTPDMALFREEVFGPVIAFTPFADEAEAVELTNAVEFGLTGGVWTDDAERAMRVAKAIDAGMIYVNNFDREMLGAPFGGYKASGLGRKLAFEETMAEFTQPKNVRFSVGAESGLGRDW